MIFNLFFALSLIIATGYSQNYELSILGVPFGSLNQKKEKNSIQFSIKSTNLLEFFLKFDNTYFTTFDTTNYNVMNFKKIIKQDKKVTSFAKLDSLNNIVYNNKDKIKLPVNSKNFFTLILMIQEESYNLIDTKWFNYEHQGNTGKARFLWADSSFVFYNKDSVLCDHYRLDIKLKKPINSIINNPDYFMDNIIKENNIIEFWVSKETTKRVIASKIKFNTIPIPIYVNLYDD